MFLVKFVKKTSLPNLVKSLGYIAAARVALNVSFIFKGYLMYIKKIFIEGKIPQNCQNRSQLLP